MITLNTEKTKQHLTDAGVENDQALVTKLASGVCGQMDTTPVAEVSLEMYKNKLKCIRKAKANELLTINGIEISPAIEDKREMQHYITETIINGLTNVYWQLPDGSFHTYTVQQFKPVYKVVVGYINGLFQHHMALLAQLEDVADPSTVDLTAGWPTKTYSV